jgi:hypothetical protein
MNGRPENDGDVFVFTHEKCSTTAAALLDPYSATAHLLNMLFSKLQLHSHGFAFTVAVAVKITIAVTFQLDAFQAW